jgi:hypothetical protein
MSSQNEEQQIENCTLRHDTSTEQYNRCRGIFIEKPTNADTLPGRRLLGCEVCLDVLDLPAADPECLGEDVGGHGRRGPEERHGDGLRALELAVEGGDDGGGAVPPVLLEVDEAAGEDEDVPRGDGLAEEPVGGGEEADLERALEDEDDLGGARVRVRRVLAARRVVDARHGDAQRVHPRELVHVGRRHRGARRVVGVARAPQPVEEEVVRRDVRLAREPVQLDRCTHTWRPAWVSREHSNKNHQFQDEVAQETLTGSVVSHADVLEHVRVAGEREGDGAGRGDDVEVDPRHDRPVSASLVCTLASALGNAADEMDRSH